MPCPRPDLIGCVPLSQGALAKTQAQAEKYAQEAADALALLPSSAARDALVVLCHKVVSRTPIK